MQREVAVKLPWNDYGGKLSPLKLTRSLDADELAQLYDATRATLQLWIDRRQQRRGGVRRRKGGYQAGQNEPDAEHEPLHL